MSVSPNGQRGRSGRRSSSRRRSSISIHETVNPPLTRFKDHRMDEAQIASIKKRKIREFYEVNAVAEQLEIWLILNIMATLRLTLLCGYSIKTKWLIDFLK